MSDLDQDKRKQFLSKISLLVTVLLFTSISIFGQQSFSDFYSQSQKINNTGMYVLGSWALANIATGAYGWSKYSGDRMYFLNHIDLALLPEGFSICLSVPIY
ncbi:MAG: hypothetical protein U9N72_05180 [Bacteroidota bacterium]|nr:hypothetical protein [Bacteroidota bacterium]